MKVVIKLTLVVILMSIIAPILLGLLSLIIEDNFIIGIKCGFLIDGIVLGAILFVSLIAYLLDEI